MDGVATPIIGRPRPLPGHDTPNPAYHPHTLNYEEPRKLELVCGDDLSVHWHLGKGALRTRGVLYPVHDVALRA